MSQQALDLRRSMQIVRRHRKIFWAVVVIGLLIGAAYAVLMPPMLTSTALVVLPQAPVSSDQGAASGTGNGATGYMDTQAVVAGSTPVLSAALPRVSPAMSLPTLRDRIRATALTESILSVSATGATAAEAEATANAVAGSYVGYVSSARSPMGYVTAKVLEPASVAGGLRLPEQMLIDGLLGALAGALAGYVGTLALGRNDRRLAERDAIANSIGAPVLASVPVGRPSGAASWAKLLAEYVPGPVPAWALRNLLGQFGLAGPAAASAAGHPPGPGFGHAAAHADGHANGRGRAPVTLTVLSLASDPKALALGPQLAVFASSLGIPTALVIGPQQDADTVAGTVAALRTACVGAPVTAGPERPLRLLVSEHGGVPEHDGVFGNSGVSGHGTAGQPAAAFTVFVTVIDAQAPRLPEVPRTTATVLGVSAGAATAEQLARAASAAATDGREISGLLVADPEPGDQTTGRIPRLAPPARLAMPAGAKDVPTETRR